MKLGWNLIAITCCALAAGATVAGADAADHAASFEVTKTRTVNHAVLTLDPSAPVFDVVLDAPGCDLGPMLEVEPGRWEATSPIAFTNLCVSATVTVHLSASAEAGAFIDAPCAFVGLEGVRMSGMSHTDGYASGDGAYAPETAEATGHVCSNGEIRLSGSATIHGNAYVGAGARLRSSGSSAVTGGVAELAAPFLPEPIDALAALVNDNAQLPRTERGADAVSGGKLSLSGGDRLVMPPGTYFFEQVKLSGGSSLEIDGPVVIHTLEAFDATGGSIVNRSHVPGDLQIVAMQGDVKLSGGSDLHALVNAPHGKITYSSHSDFYGMLMGEELVLTGSAGLHADADATGGATPADSFSLGWEESLGERRS